MARIPDSSQLGYSVPRTPRTPRFQDRSGEIVADAVGRFAQTAGQAAYQIQEKDDQFGFARAKTALLQADVDARNALENDGDWQTYEKRYSEKMTQAREKAAGMIRGNRDRALFDMDAKLDFDRGVGEVRNIAKRKEVDWGRASLDEMLESSRTAALSAKDEQTRAALIAATQDAIEGARLKGYLTEQEATNQRQLWTASYAEGFVGMQPAEKRIELLSQRSRSAEGPLAEVYADYPGLAQYGFQFRDSPGLGRGRKLEFYPPGESHSPFEDKTRPGIERFDPAMGKTDFFGEMLHHVPRVDKRVGEMRDAFQDSITAEQEEQWLRGDYQSQLKKGIFGERVPTFDQWLKKQGGDAFFRGFLTGQYPSEAYTPGQKEMFMQLDAQLREGQSQRAGSVADLIAPDRRAELLKIAQNEKRIADERAEAEARKATVNSTSARIISEYTKHGPEAGAAALQKLNLKPEVMREVWNSVNSDLSRLREVRQQENASAIADLNSRIQSETAGSDALVEADLLWNKGAFTPAEYASAVGRIEASQLRGATNAATATEIRRALETGVPLDPANETIRKALSTTFKQDVQDVPIGSPAWQAAAGAYATRTRMLPEPAIAWTRASMRSPDPSIVAAAAEFIGGIDTTAGDALSGLDANTKAMAGMINSMISAGTDPKKAAEMARSQILDANPAIVKSREDQYAKGGQDSLAASSTGTLRGLVDRDFDSWASAEPAVTQALDVDFRDQVGRYFVRTGDIELSNELAWADLKRVYGPTYVNGGRQMMAFPPERFGVTRENLLKDLSSFLESSPQADGSTADNLILVPDALTMRQVRGALDGKPVMPSYRLMTKSGDLALNAKGEPQRYSLPGSEDMVEQLKLSEQAAAAAAAAQIEEARRARAERAKRDHGYSGPGILR
jgi:hypothetical protein